MFYWLYIFYQNHITSPFLYWLPFGNISCLLITRYIDNEMLNLVGDVEVLNSLVYNYKSA